MFYLYNILKFVMKTIFYIIYLIFLITYSKYKSYN